jgi:hypothetical protein
VILGGTGATNGDPGPTAPFQGYGSRVRDNFFSYIRQGVTLQSDTNSSVVEYNTFASTSGSQTSGAIVLGSTPTSGKFVEGNVIENNLIEVPGYTVGIDLIAAGMTTRNYLAFNNCWDNVAGFVGCIRIASGVNSNMIIPGIGGSVADVSDANSPVTNTVIGSGSNNPSVFNQNVSFVNRAYTTNAISAEQWSTATSSTAEKWYLQGNATNHTVSMMYTPAGGAAVGQWGWAFYGTNLTGWSCGATNCYVDALSGNMRLRIGSANTLFLGSNAQLSDTGTLTTLNLKLTGQAQPTCSSGTPGQFWYSGHSTGVKDSVAVCAADATNTYAWRTIY